MQWRILTALVLALIVAVFAVANVRAEPINFLFGVTYVPLVLIIFGAAVLGGLSVAAFSVYGRVKQGVQSLRGTRGEDGQSPE